VRVFTVPPECVAPEALREPARILREGGVVAFPTETVYGLGVNSQAPGAVARLAALKQRPEGKPFSYHLSSVDRILELVGAVPEPALKLIRRYCPGPLTLVLPVGAGAERRMVGVRVPANDLARMLIELAGSPLLVPSANPSGAAPAICADDVIRYFGDQIDAVVDGGTVLLKEASTVVRFDENGYEVLREGIISKEMIHQLLEGRRVLFVCTGNTCRSPMAAELYKKHLMARLGKARDELQEIGYRILSAGTLAGWGCRPSEHAVTVMKEMDCDLSNHVSQPVTEALLAEVDHVVAMGRQHYDWIERMLEGMDRGARPRLEMLLESGITDPVGGDIETYRVCAREIEEAVLRILPR
jgi:tRNA threonylcarbamoyl adenosine modification protein (Sua5/YciO/YrdC/YwlC family)